MARDRCQHLRRQGVPGHPGHDRLAQHQRVLSLLADHRGLLRRRAGLARAGAQDRGDHRRRARAGLDVRGAQDAGDLAGADLHHAGRRRRLDADPGDQGLFRLRAGQVPAVVCPAELRRPDHHGGPGDLRAGAGPAQVRRLGGDGGLPDRQPGVERARLRGQPLPVRLRRPGDAALGHERARPLLDRRLLVPRLLGRLRADPAGAGRRAVAARDRDADHAAPAAPADAPDGAVGRDPGTGPGRVRRLRRLHLLQHPRPQPLPHHDRGRAVAGRLREEVPALRAPAAAEGRLAEARHPDLAARRPGGDARPVRDPEPHRRPDRLWFTCASRAT